jgi:hypothetical protein
MIMKLNILVAVVVLAILGGGVPSNGMTAAPIDSDGARR